MVLEVFQILVELIINYSGIVHVSFLFLPPNTVAPFLTDTIHMFFQHIFSIDREMDPIAFRLFMIFAIAIAAFLKFIDTELRIL